MEKRFEWRKVITVHGAINFLNKLLELDGNAINKLVGSRVECNEALAKHPTVQVQRDGTRTRIGKEEAEIFEVGLLGVLNGIFGINEDGFGQIVADFNKNCRIVGFRHLNEPNFFSKKRGEDER